MTSSARIAALELESLKNAQLKAHNGQLEVGQRFATKRPEELGTYVAVRRFPKLGCPADSFVDSHVHSVPSLWLALGNGPGLKGLSIGAKFEAEKVRIIRSPAAVWIPEGLSHAYWPLAGSGLYINVVFAVDYNGVTTF
jgi:hypothetical protein